MLMHDDVFYTEPYAVLHQPGPNPTCHYDCLDWDWGLYQLQQAAARGETIANVTLDGLSAIDYLASLDYLNLVFNSDLAIFVNGVTLEAYLEAQRC